jgi:DNA polymerase-3 subunit epsilon
MRPVWVCDLETSGLTASHVPLEVAAVPVGGNLGMSPHYFVPFTHGGIISSADRDALRINRFFERGVYENESNPVETRKHYVKLHDALTGSALAGCNPRFDAGMLSRVFANYGLEPEPWHHRLPDLSAYAAGALGIHPGELPGLDKVCQHLGVVNDEPHSAMGDAKATARCFEILIARARGNHDKKATRC